MADDWQKKGAENHKALFIAIFLAVCLIVGA